MKRLRILAFGAAIVVALVAPASANAYGDVKGPKCADLVAGDSSKASYQVGAAAGTYMVDVQLQLSAPSCSNIEYTFEVYAADGTLLVSATRAGGDGATDAQTGLPVIVLHVEFAGDGAPVNTVATTSRNGKVLDRGPDLGFVTLDLGSAGAGRGYG